MTTDKDRREQMLAFCGEIHEDDGIDPRQWFTSPRNRDKQDRKNQQLCSQVGETIDRVLSGEFDDELLHNLRVIEVTPAPDCSQLLVTLFADLEPGRATVDEIMQHLDKAVGRLRSEVAIAITRKRTPQLAFRIIEAEEQPS